jgi:hypothetical protein
VTARRLLLGGRPREADIPELVSELAPLRPRSSTFPGEVFLHVAADALTWCKAGVPVGQACQDLAQRPGHPAP